MASAAQDVWRLINEDIVIRRAMEKDIVSMKALAVHLIKENKLEISSDAAISAIRRYTEARPIGKQYDGAKKVIAHSKDIRTISNIVIATIEKNRRTQELLQKAFSLADYDKGELLLVMQGEQSIKLLFNGKNKKRILGIFQERTIHHIEDNVAEINIQLDDTAMKTPGILAVFTNELMMNEINLIEMMSCLPELLFFVKQRDVVKAYEVLFGLTSISGR